MELAVPEPEEGAGLLLTAIALFSNDHAATVAAEARFPNAAAITATAKRADFLVNLIVALSPNPRSGIQKLETVAEESRPNASTDGTLSQAAAGCPEHRTHDPTPQPIRSKADITV
jgi:hypothetical protein